MISSDMASLLYSGFYNDTELVYVGTGGFWRSSNVYMYDNEQSYNLYLTKDGIYPQNQDGKHRGFAVRCVAKN